METRMTDTKKLIETIEGQLEEREQELESFLVEEGIFSYELVECMEEDLECSYDGESIEEGEEVYEVDRMESMYVKKDSMRLYLIQQIDSARMRLEMAKEL